MKYKLLKDTPKIKAGTIDRKVFFEINLNINPENYIWEWFEEVKENKTIYDLKEWDRLYYISDVNKTNWVTFTNDEKSFIEIGNAFLTKNEAEKELNKRIAWQTIRKFSIENDDDYKFIRWERNYLIEIYLNEFDIERYDEIENYNTQYYSSKEIAEKALKELNKKYRILFDLD